MKSFIEMICEADQNEQQIELRLKEIKDKKTPSKTLVGFLKSSDQKVSAAAEEELKRRKQAGEDVAGYEDEDSMSDDEGQPIPPEVNVNTGEELPVNADSIARELDVKVHPDEEQDKKNKALKVKPNQIVLNPEYQARIGISEAKERSVVFSFGRMNPITVGHEKLVSKLVSVASSKKADVALYVSSSQDKKKNPLPYDKKLKYAKIAFPKVMRDLPKETKSFGMLIGILKSLDKKYDHLTMVVGSDRVDTMKNLLNKYNGKEYEYKSIDVVSAGERDPDADDVSGISASKMRQLAVQGDFESFKKGLPAKLKSSAKSMFDDVRAVMINEEEVSEAVLSVQQRLKKRAVIKRSKGRVRVGQRKAIRRKASGKVIDRRAKRVAIRFMRKRILKGKKYNELSYSARAAVDRIVARRAVAIKRIAQRLSPKVRRAESQRKSGSGFKSVSLSPSRKVRKENFDAYKDMYGDYMTEQNFLDFVHNVFDDLSEEFTVDLTFAEEKYLMNRAEQSGESFDTLKKVFDRGVASWSMGLHEDVTPQQWAFSRVNSFINEGAARKTADIDLAEAEMFGISKAISPIIHMHSYKAAKKLLQQVWNRKKEEAAKVSRERGPKHDITWYAAQIARQYHGVDAKKLAKMVQEETIMKEDKTEDSHGNFIDVAGNRVGIMSTMSFKDFMNTTPKTEEVKEPTGDLKDACWKGYTAVGMKMKNGKKVPNCVPVKEEAAWNKTKKLPLTPAEKKIIGNSGVYKETYKLDRTQSIYRASKTSYSMPFTGKEDLVKLNKLASLMKKQAKNEEVEEVSEAKGSNYQLYHNTYSSAINHALAHHEKSGLSVHDDDRWDKVAVGSKKPSSGKTTSVHIPATHTKTGKKHMIHVQVYNKGGSNPYELNTYSSTHRNLQKEEAGAGFQGTDELVKKYKSDTPGQQIDELSKDTMRSYAGKAMADASSKSTSSMGMELQAKQMRKQSPTGDSRTADRLDSASKQLDDKAKRRMKFARKAIGKLSEEAVDEATYQGKEVPLNKPMAGDVKKSKVYVDPDGDGQAQKVNFGDKNMTIKKDIPARRKSFRARHKCDTAKDKTTPRYWSCKKW